MTAGRLCNVEPLPFHLFVFKNRHILEILWDSMNKNQIKRDPDKNPDVDPAEGSSRCTSLFHSLLLLFSSSSRKRGLGKQQIAKTDWNNLATLGVEFLPETASAQAI
jgi:hypothetical protein